MAVTQWLNKAIGRTYVDLRSDVGPADKLSLVNLPYRLPEGYKDKSGGVKKSCLKL